MAAHDHHESLPGYDSRQILVSGCTECDWRGQHLDVAVSNLDTGSFRRAWDRAAQFNVSSAGMNVSRAEAPLLNLLGMIQIAAERSGLAIGPVGGLRQTMIAMDPKGGAEAYETYLSLITADHDSTYVEDPSLHFVDANGIGPTDPRFIHYPEGESHGCPAVVDARNGGRVVWLCTLKTDHPGDHFAHGANDIGYARWGRD